MSTEKTNDKHNYKLSDAEFLAALRENQGMDAVTAKATEEKYGVSYSRQAVRERAQNFPEELKQIRDSIVELCETEILKCVKQDNDMKLKFKAASYMLNSIGKRRDYGKKGVDEIAEQLPKEVFEIDGKIVRF